MTGVETGIALELLADPDQNEGRVIWMYPLLIGFELDTVIVAVE